MNRFYGNRKEKQPSMSDLLRGADSGHDVNKRNALADVKMNHNRILGNVDDVYMVPADFTRN